LTKNSKIYLIIFLLSLSVLSFEIILARIFSYVLAYHFVLIIIAFSILAIALGQLYASQVVVKNHFSLSKYFNALQLLFPISLAAVFVLPLIESIGSGSVGLIIYILLAGITFFLIGVITASIFQNNGEKSGILYALDMAGAASGSLLGLFLLNTFSVVQALAIILLVFSVAALTAIKLDSRVRKGHLEITASAIIASFLIIFTTPDIEINMAKSLDKDLLRLKSNPSVKSLTIESRWNSFGRTDLVKFIYPDSTTSISMFIDGAAGTQVVAISELEKDSVKLFHTLMHSNIFFPFNFLKDNEKDSALIIGPGGGIDIAAAYFGNTKHIDAVEVNPTFVELMKKYNKTTFIKKPNINIFVGEGRNYVRNTAKKYDLIFLTIPITKGGRSTDFVNLTENYLFTEEALKDYLHILTNEGRIVFTLHNREEVYKVVSNYLDLQNKAGISDSEAFKYFYIADQGMMPLLVIKKTFFTNKEIIARHIVSHQNGFDKGISFFPFSKQIEIDTVVQGVNYKWSMFDNVLYDISNNKYSFHDLTEKASINLHPVTDNSPFFFNYELGLPDNLNILIFAGIILFGLSIYMFKKNWGMSINVHQETAPSRKNLRILTIVSFLLGFAYILSQSYLFQAMNLQLNNPLKSFSLLLFSFLLGNGLGSYLSNFIKENRIRVIGLVVFGIILTLAIDALVIMPSLITSVSEFYLFSIVFIPAIVIGIPFPLLLAEMNKQKIRNGIAVLLSISGIAGFIGSIFTISIAILAGYNFVLYLAFGLYLIIIIATTLRLPTRKDN
jgi:precorrin-6B methylase 2